MNKLFTLACIVLSFTVHGRTTGITIPTLYPHFGSSQPSVNNMGPVPVRLVSRVKTVFDGSIYRPFDSSAYSYSSGRGGILDLDYSDNFLNFDNSIYYTYEEDDQKYKDGIRYTQTFNSADNIEYRTQENWINDQLLWQNSVRHEYVYNSGLSRLEQTNINIWNGSWMGNSMNYKLTYNAKNDIIEIKFVTSVTELTYDMNHNVTERKEYIYTTSEGWHYSDNYNFRYDASDNLTSYTYQKFINGNWVNSLKKDFIYTGNDLANTIEYSWKNNAWQEERRNIFTYDASGNKVSDEYQIWDEASGNFVNTRKEEWTYNAQNQPLTYKSLTWDAGNQNWKAVKNDFLYHYKYEFYNPASVKNTADAKDIFTLYPQPASDLLNISFKQAANENYEGSIYDLMGKTVKSFEINAQKNSIPVGELPPGNYMISLTNRNKKTAQPLVIAH